jgi:hypothetical protein
MGVAIVEAAMVAAIARENFIVMEVVCMSDRVLKRLLLAV